MKEQPKVSIKWALRYYGAYCAMGHDTLYALPLTFCSPFSFVLFREEELIKLGEFDETILRHGVNGKGYPCLWVKAIPFKVWVDSHCGGKLYKTRVKSFNKVGDYKDETQGDITLGAPFERMVAEVMNGKLIGREAGGRAVHADVLLTNGQQIECKFHGGQFAMNRKESSANYTETFPLDQWLDAMAK